MPGDRLSAPVQRRRLQQIGRGRPDLATQGEALNHARHDREDRGRDTDPGVGEDERDGDERRPHHREAQHHGRLSSHAIAIGPDHQAADRPGDEPRREGAQREHRAAIGAALGGKEGVADLDLEEGVGDEVIEFERVPQGGGHHETTRESRARGDNFGSPRLIRPC